jgi:hypothetical protein
VPVADPYDSAYLGLSEQRLRQIARVLNAKQKLRLDETLQFASFTDELLRESEQRRSSDYCPTS